MTSFLKRFTHLIHHKRSLRFTPAGTRFVILTLTIGVAAINTGNNLLYLILAMLLSFIILSGILSEYNIRNLSVSRILPSHPFADTRSPYYLKIKNHRRRLPSFSCTIQDTPAAYIQTEPVYIYHLRDGHQVLSESHICFKQRGRHNLTSIQIETGFPFGFFKKSLIRNNPQEIVVYPKLLSLPREFLTSLGGSGEFFELYQQGHSSSIRNLRDYTPGSDARAIHWKASARQGKLLLKEFEEEDDARFVICLYNMLPDPSSEEGSLELEKAISLAASLAHQWLMEGHSVELQTLTENVPMGRGIPHLYQILHTLAVLQPAERTSGNDRFFISSNPLVPRLLILPREGSYLEFNSSEFVRILLATDPEIQSLWKNRHQGFPA